MKSRLHISGHPIHAMVVGLPIGLYNAALLSDVVCALVSEPFWFRMSFWAITFGLIFHVAAIVTGMPDYLAVVRTKSKARPVAHSHLIFGISLLVIQGLNVAVRNGGNLPADGSIGMPLVVNLIAVTVLGVQGWYGGELVYKHKVGIEE